MRINKALLSKLPPSIAQIVSDFRERHHKLSISADRRSSFYILGGAGRKVRSGRGPSPEYKEAYRKARLIWRKWSDALDIEAGRKPAFATSTGDR